MDEKDKETFDAEKEEPAQQALFSKEEDPAASNQACKSEDGPRTPADIRQASYLVLTIAAIFIINAMETGSYRTPWPVAIVVTIAGLGLLVYSFIKAKRENSDT